MVDDSIVRIDILDHADFCGEFRADRFIPGLRKFYNAIESVRSLNPENTLLLDAGDEINRLLWHGKDVLDGISLIGTDAWSLGNHEFDKGREHLQENIDYICGTISVLCANIVLKENGELIRNVRPYQIFEKSAIKIGVIGVCTEYSERMITYPNFEPFKAISAAEAIRQYTNELKSNDVDIVIVLAHIGATETDGVQHGELFELLEKIKDLPIDLLIGGHTNGDIAQEYNGIMVNKGGFSGKSLIHTVLYFDRENRKIVRKEAEVLYPLEDKYNMPVDRIDSFVTKVLEPFDSVFNDSFALAKEDLLMNYHGESAMGNMLADAVREAVGTDFAYFNTTSCGPIIPVGNITRYTLKQAVYFDEYVCVTEMTVGQIRQLFSNMLDPQIYSKNLNMFFSGLRIAVDTNAEKSVDMIRVFDYSNTELPDDRLLKVATSEYMASGGNDTRKIAHSCKWTVSNTRIHEAIENYLRKIKVIDNHIDGRFIQK